MKPISIVVLIFLLAAVSCAPTGKIVEHSKPDLKIDNTYFENLGCFEETGCSAALPQDLDFQGFWIEEPSDLLGGLDPVIPLAVVQTISFSHDPTIPAVYSGTCTATISYNYLVFLDGKIRALDSKADFAAVFAPIDSPEEALSYAVASTGYMALYDLELIKDIQVLSKKLEETHVSTKKGGYVVHLFDLFLCHCGPHVIRSVEVTVNVDGTVSVSEPVDAFSDPELDNACFD